MTKKRRHSPGSDLTIEERRNLMWVKICDLIEKQGFYIQGVFGSETEPPFTYTVGLAPDGPELILFGLDHEVAAHIFHTIVDQVSKDGKVFKSGQAYTGLVGNDLPLYFRDITDDIYQWADYMGAALRWHQEHGRVTFPIFQICWPDPTGKFPWQDGFEEKYRDVQPLLFTFPTETR